MPKKISQKEKVRRLVDKLCEEVSDWEDEEEEEPKGGELERKTAEENPDGSRAI